MGPEAPIMHPSFDHYMQSILFQRKDVEANFKGYFESGSRFTANQTINDLPFTFEDYHWTMADYVSAIDTAGLRIRKIDECRSVSGSLSADDTEWAARRDRFPTYCVIVASR